MGIINGVAITTSESEASVNLEFDDDLEIKLLKGWFVLFGDPQFNAIRMNVRTYNADELQPIMHSSEWVLRAEILASQEDAYKNIPFVFTTPFPWNKAEIMRVSVELSYYTYSYDSHVSWVLENEPVYGIDVNQLSVQVIGAKNDV